MEEAQDPARPLYCYRFGNAEFDEARFELRVGGLAVELQHKPLQLLALLLATPGQVVSREQIEASIWASRVTVDNVIANAVSKLRSALGEDNGRLLVTVPRVGYRLLGPVKRIAVGRPPVSQLALHAGMPVPGREHFELMLLLGSSAAGESWLARHRKSGDQRVYKFGNGGAALANLKREVTIYRVLRESLGEREDIARIVDWNFEQPPFFIECNYGGLALDRWAREDDGARLLRIGVEQRLALLLQAIDAVAAAHGVGVLHRDLKPANILVAPAAGGGWQARLTDFGSARLLDPDQLDALRITRLGMTEAGAGSDSGTPFYIAPEIALGQAPTVRSDVFALGVILYQLLAGDLRKPMAPGWEREIGDELLCQDIARATDVDPQHRLGSAAELGMRLRELDARRRSAAGERAAAARAAAIEQALARDRARRPWVIAAMAALLAGAAASTWLYLAERRTAAALAQQYALASSLNRLLREDLIASANPAAAGRADITVADALSATAAQIERRYASLPPATRAGLHQAMQAAFSELSRVQDAAVEGRRALDAFAQAAAPDPQAVQDVRLRLALDLAQMSRSDEAAPLMRDLERDAGPAAGQAPGFRARLLYVKAWQSGDGVTLETAERQLREAWALVEPMTSEQAPWREKILFALADTLRLRGANAESEALFRRLLAEQTAALGAGHVRTYYTMVGLANAVSQQQRAQEAIVLLDSAARGLAAKLGARHRMALSATEMLAGVHVQQHEYELADDEFGRVHRGYVALMGADSSYTIAAQISQGIARHRAGRAAQAEPLLRDALQRVRSFAADGTPQLQQARFALADCLLDLRRKSEVAALIDGLDPAVLNDAQQEPDWPQRLARLRERLARLTVP